MPERALFLGPNKRKIFPKKKHVPIYYSAMLSDDKKTIQGTWKIKFGFIFLWFLPVPTMPASGKFEMQRLE